MVTKPGARLIFKERNKSEFVGLGALGYAAALPDFRHR